MKKIDYTRWIVSLLAVFAIVCAWEIAVKSSASLEFILPPPTAVASYIFEAIGDGSLLTAVAVTVKRLLVGYAIGICIGIPVGMLCSRFNTFNDTIGLLSLGLQALPSVCWAPLAIMWFGLSESAMLFVVVMGTVWSMIIATEHGVKNIPQIYLRASATMGSKGLHRWIHVIMPASFPSIVSGMKQGWAFAWRSLMAAEIYVAIVPFGLGQLLNSGREFQNMNQVIGVMCVVIVIGLLVDKAMFSPLESRLRKKWGIAKD